MTFRLLFCSVCVWAIAGILFVVFTELSERDARERRQRDEAIAAWAKALAACANGRVIVIGERIVECKVRGER